MTDRTYDILKICALLVLPIGTFVATVCSIWNLPHTDEIQATFVAADVLMGAIVTIANEMWKRSRT